MNVERGEVERGMNLTDLSYYKLQKTIEKQRD
jgi:hypothetical protein